MARGLAALLGCIAAVWATAAWAQDTRLVPSEALACLSPPLAERGQPEYPAEALARKDGATLHVELRFHAPDAAPRLRLLNKEFVLESWFAAIRTHVAKLRVPCMNRGRPVTLRQTYVFNPEDGRRVFSEAPTDPDQLVRGQLLACMTHVDRAVAPPYPDTAQRLGLQGKVLIQLKFTRPNAPPELERLAPARNNVLTKEVGWHVEGLRLPCLQDEPISVQQIYVFQFDGGARTVLKPLTLRELVSAADRMPRPFAADLNLMGCPFELRWVYFQPYALNSVSELETTNPARRPLLDWLEQISLKLPTPTQEAVVGDVTTLSVPCGTVNL